MKRQENIEKMITAFGKYGFTCKETERLELADFQVIDDKNEETIKVLSCLTFQKKYRNQNIHIGFFIEYVPYCYPHDELLEIAEDEGDSFCTKNGGKGNGSWERNKPCTWTKLPEYWKLRLQRYKLA